MGILAALATVYPYYLSTTAISGIKV